VGWNYGTAATADASITTLLRCGYLVRLVWPLKVQAERTYRSSSDMGGCVVSRSLRTTTIGGATSTSCLSHVLCKVNASKDKPRRKMANASFESMGCFHELRSNVVRRRPVQAVDFKGKCPLGSTIGKQLSHMEEWPLNLQIFA
jgi:hypothetical protein